MSSQPNVPALIFGPGLPSDGARGIVSVSALCVEAAAGDVSVRASLAEVSLREVGFDERGLELTWTSRGDRWAVHVLDADATRGLLSTPALATTPMADALLNRRRRSAAARSLGWSLLGGLILLPAVLLLLFVLNSNRIAVGLPARFRSSKRWASVAKPLKACVPSSSSRAMYRLDAVVRYKPIWIEDVVALVGTLLGLRPPAEPEQYLNSGLV